MTGGETDGDISINGFGIGAPMGNMERGTIEHPAGLPWKGILPVADLFNRHTDMPVKITNDANAAAVGEMIFGRARDMTNFVMITLGTGLGSAFVIDGKLVYGHDGFAGEIGHTAIGPGVSGRQCGCGKKGCLETYVSATGVKRSLFSIMAESIEPSELRHYSFEEMDAEMIYKAALKGDALAKETLTYTGKILGFKLADIVAHTNPEAIFLFGGLALAGDFIIKPARKYMEENLLDVYRGKIKLMPSGLNDKNAAVLGAGSLIWSIYK
jgi:glucokinase